MQAFLLGSNTEDYILLPINTQTEEQSLHPPERKPLSCFAESLRVEFVLRYWNLKAWSFLWKYEGSLDATNIYIENTLYTNIMYTTVQKFCKNF